MKITEMNAFKVRPLEVKFSKSTSSKTGKNVVVCSVMAEIRQPCVNGMYLLPTDWDAEDSMWKSVVNVTGKAVCTEGDEYSYEKGMKVAQAKAESKMYEVASRRLKKLFSEFVDGMSKMVEDFDSKAEVVMEHNESYIDRITAEA